MELDTQVSLIEDQVKDGNDTKGEFDISLAPAEEEELVTNGGLHFSESKELVQNCDDNVPYSETIKARKASGTEEAEAALVGEFVKPDMETIGIKEKEHKHSVEGRTMRDDNLLAMQKRTKCLELDLENMKTQIEVSRFEKSNLQNELSIMKESLKEKTKNSIDHELNQKHLNEQLESAQQEANQYKQLYHSQSENLQIALKSKHTIQNELHDAKEAEDVLIAELQLSKQKIEELEQEMSSLTGQARKALELQKLLEQENLKTKEMEHQIEVLQHELHGLYENFANNEQVEDTLKSTLLELSAVQDELRLSRTHELDLEQQIASSELQREQTYSAELEKKVKPLQDLLAESEIRAKNAMESNLKYQGMLHASDAAKEAAESKLRKTESELTILGQKNLELQEELRFAVARSAETDKVVKEFQARTFELFEMLRKVEEETKLLKMQLGEHKDKIIYLESALSESSVRNSELEEELKLASEKHAEREIQLIATDQRKLELEDLIQASHSKAEDAGRCVAGLELLLKNSEQERNDLEQHCRSIETNCAMAETESKQYSSKLSEVSADLEVSLAKILDLEASLQHANKKEMELMENLKDHEEERTKLSGEIRHLQSALDDSNLKINDLEKDVRVAAERCLEHESRARLTHQRSIKLEDMMHISRSKSEYSERKVAELEMFLKVSEEKQHELEEHLTSLEMQFLDAEEERERYASKVSNLSEELQASQAKVSTLELLLNYAERRETELKENLARVTDERTNYMDKIKQLESDLNQSTLRNLELEQELKVAMEKCTDHEGRANMYHQKSLELEGLIQLANSKTKDAETESLNQASIVSKLSQDLKDFQAKVSSLELALHNANIDELKLKEHLFLAMQEQEKFKETVKQLESNINLSSMRKLEIEKELEIVREKCREEEDLASMHQQRCLELEIQTQIAESKVQDAKIECESYASKVFKLTDDLESSLKRISSLEIALRYARAEETEAKENLALVITERKYFEDKIRQLEGDLDKLSTRNMELEQELKVILLKVTEHEGQASFIRQRSLHLEDMIRVSHSKAEDTDKKVAQLEILLKDSEQKKHELEMQLHFARSECKQHADRLSELSLELEASLVNASTLEVALIDANKTKGELRQTIHLITQEKKRLEDASNDYSVKLSQVENLLEILQHELRMTQQKLVAAEKGHENALQKESELLKKLKVLEEQLGHQKFIIEQSDVKFQKLESISNDTEWKLQEALEKLNKEDSEAENLLEQLNALGKQAAAYQEQATEASSGNKSLQSQLEEHLAKLISLEEVCEQLKDKVVDGENKAKMSYLVETTKKLKGELKAYHTKVCQLEQMLQSVQDAKEATIEEIKIHKDSINELTDKHARTLELYSAAESRIADAERKLHEAIERYKVRDSDAMELHENLQLIESQLMMYKDKAIDAEKVVESQKIEMEEAFSKLVHFEGEIKGLQTSCSKLTIENEASVETNQKLSRELAASLTRISDLQVTLSSVQEENNEAVKQLMTCKKTIDELIEQHKVEKQKFQSQEMESETELERESFLKNTFAELAAKKQEATLLEKQVEEDKRQLKQYDSILKKKEEKIILLTRELEELRTKINQFSELVKKVEFLENELKSERLKFDIQVREVIEKKNRDLHLGTASPANRKSKSKAEQMPNPSVKASSLTGFKLILAVAIISLIMGVILGKRN